MLFTCLRLKIMVLLTVIVIALRVYCNLNIDVFSTVQFIATIFFYNCLNVSKVVNESTMSMESPGKMKIIVYQYFI